jgi:hypothetical protein
MASGRLQERICKSIRKILFLYTSREDVFTKTARRVSLREGNLGAQSLGEKLFENCGANDFLILVAERREKGDPSRCDPGSFIEIL